jgi:signal transduction histidine kinase
MPLVQGDFPGEDALAGPRLELDENLASLIQRAQEMLAAQSRLRGLLRATRSVVGDLDLDGVLTRIIEAACELVEADYGALGVVGADRRGLERFVHVGLDEATVQRIGHLPEGRGLLGLLIDEPAPIRLRDLREHACSVGFPAHHPLMQGFIGVPIRVRGEIFGNLYLTRREGKEFTEEDEELVLALAGTAGIAIENARRFEEAQRRQEWLATSTEVTRRLLADATEQPLEAIAESVFHLADADLVTVVVPSEDGEALTLPVAVGAEAANVARVTYPLEGTVSQHVLDTGRPVRLASARDTAAAGNRLVFLAGRVDLGPVLVLPLVGAGGVRGVLWVGRLTGGRPFTTADEEMVATFANQASIAWELADARRTQRRVDLLEDRARIARDLHDHVIQRLFAAGLTLQAVAPQASAAGATLETVIDELDDVIKQIRSAIFQLRPATSGLRAAVLDVVGEVRSSLGFEPHVVFDGPVDNVSTDDLLNDVTAVLREALTNVAKHAAATAAAVRVTAAGGDLTLLVSDNGRGIGEPRRSSGLANLRTRAQARAGTLVVAPAPDRSGTTLEWRVPVPRRTAGA